MSSHALSHTIHVRVTKGKHLLWSFSSWQVVKVWTPVVRMEK